MGVIDHLKLVDINDCKLGNSIAIDSTKTIQKISNHLIKAVLQSNNDEWLLITEVKSYDDLQMQTRSKSMNMIKKIMIMQLNLNKAQKIKNAEFK